MPFIKQNNLKRRKLKEEYRERLSKYIRKRKGSRQKSWLILSRKQARDRYKAVINSFYT